MEVLLDSSFIISCIRAGIDFLSELEGQGFRVKLPLGVYQELKDLKMRSVPADREAIELALLMFEQRKVKKIRVGGKNVDEGLIEKGKQGIYIATLDRGIKREIPNRVVIDSAKKGIRVDRQ